MSVDLLLLRPESGAAISELMSARATLAISQPESDADWIVPRGRWTRNGQ